jgi:hypothetical protein
MAEYTRFGIHDKDPSTPSSADYLEQFGEHIAGFAADAAKAPASDQTLYVSASGDDATGDGRSPASAFKTIQKAVDEAGAGWRIHVGNGLAPQETRIVDKDALHIIGTALWPGDNRGTTISPASDTGHVFYLEDCDFTRVEYLHPRNTSRAKWRGVLVYGKNCNHTRVVDCGLSNNTSVCNPDTNGTLGGTGVVFVQGENNRVIETDFNGLHLTHHFSRENAQSHIIGGSVVNCYRVGVLDNAYYTTDEFADYATFGYLEGSPSVLGATGGELASLKAEPAQTIKHAQLFTDVQEQSVAIAKIKIGKGDGLALTAKNVYVTTNPAESQTPVNGGNIKLKSVTGVPAKGLIWSSDREVYSYDGVDAVNKEVENIQRKQLGSTSTVSSGVLGATQTLNIPTGDALLFRYNQKAQELQICKRVAGVTTVLTSAALAKAEGESIYLYAESEDNYLRCQAFSGAGDDPVNKGDPHWAYGTPLATVEFTLEGADVAKFGEAKGYEGHRLDTENTAWRMEDYRLWHYAGAPAGRGQIKRQKATAGGPCKRRDGTALSTSLTTPVRPTHRCEYHGWIHPKSNRILGEALDWDEGATGQYYYFGGGHSEWVNCILNGYNEIHGDFSVFSDCTMGNVEVYGKRNGFLNGTEWNSYEEFVAQGYNYFDTVDAAANGNIPEHGLLSAATEPGARWESIARVQRLPVAPKRIERWYGHHFREGCVSEPVSVNYGGAVANGFMIVVPVFGRATWSKVTFKVGAGGKGNLRVGIYALDPHTRLPIVDPDFPTTPSRLSDFGQAVATEEKQQVITVGTPVVTTCDWVGFLIYGRVGTEAKLSGLVSQVGSPAPFGYDEAIDPAPPIFARFSVPEGGAPSLPVFHSFSTSGPIVRAYRSA